MHVRSHLNVHRYQLPITALPVFIATLPVSQSSIALLAYHARPGPSSGLLLSRVHAIALHRLISRESASTTSPIAVIYRQDPESSACSGDVVLTSVPCGDRVACLMDSLINGRALRKSRCYELPHHPCWMAANDDGNLSPLRA